MIQTCEHGSVVIVVLPPFVFLLLDSRVHGGRGLTSLEWGTSNLYPKAKRSDNHNYHNHMFRNGKVQGMERGVTLPHSKLAQIFWVKKKEILPAELLVKVSYAISRHVGLEGRGDSIRYLHPGRTSHGLQGTDSWENHSKDWAPIKWVNV